MDNDIIYSSHYIIIKLHKPIYGTNYAIRDKYIIQAIKSRRKLLLRTPEGQEIIDPKQYKKESRKIEKEFLIPGKPMVLYQRTLHLSDTQPIEKYTMEW